MNAVDSHKLPLEPERAPRVLLIAGSGRRQNGCPGLDSKARYLMLRMAERLPRHFLVDSEDIGNEHGRPKIQPCNGCVGSSMALCVWPCNCYGPQSTSQPDLLWDLMLYQRLARSDAWAIIGPVWWYGPTSVLKLLFDRLVCASGGNPRPDLIDKKSTVKAQLLEKSPVWRDLSRNHLEGRTAAFFSYGNGGANDLDEDQRPKALKHKAWFDPEQEPYEDDRLAYQGLVWQCRYSGVEVPDSLWAHVEIGKGEPYADDQIPQLRSRPELARFDAWVDAFAKHVTGKGLVPGVEEAERSAQPTA